VAGTVVLAVALGWCVAALSVRGLRPWERLRAVAAGTAALALWVPLPLIGFMAFMVAAYVPLLFPILVGVMLVLVWAEVWATGALASHATKSLLGLRQPDHGAI
jgi:hypothetical protein